MLNALLVVVAFALLVFFVWRTIDRNRRGIVAQRGTSIGQDIGTMNDRRKARITSFERISADQVRIVLTAGTDNDVNDDIVVGVEEGGFADEQLRAWWHGGQELAVVMPEGTPLVRLRSVDDLQPMTLRRVGG